MISRLLLFFIVLSFSINAGDFIANGDTEKQVRDRLGKPTQAGGAGNRKTLFYGKSKILLYKGKVISFYEAELKRELKKIKEKGHPTPKRRKTEASPAKESEALTGDGKKKKRPTRKSLTAEKKKIMNDYRQQLIAKIQEQHRGGNATRQKRLAKTAKEAELNELVNSYGLTPATLTAGFKGYLGIMKIQQKFTGDNAILVGENLSHPVLAMSFGLQHTPLNHTGMLGVVKVNGVYHYKDMHGVVMPIPIIEPFMTISEQRDKLTLPLTPSTDMPQNKSDGKRFGSGFFILPGYVITNTHVISKGKKIQIYLSTDKALVRPLQARVMTSYPQAKEDLTLLRISSSNDRKNVIPLSPNVKLAANVFSCGFPSPSISNFQFRVTNGIISGKSGYHGVPYQYQFTAALNKGASGGPVVDTFGNLIGVNAIKINKSNEILQNTNFCIKQTIVARILRQNGLQVRYGEVNTAPQEDNIERIEKATVLISVE